MTPNREFLPYAVTAFLSAFLLFFIQPLMGKHLLPLFGGASSVWTTVMLFFTTLLIGGYAYAFFIQKQGAHVGAKIHRRVICAVVVLLALLWLVRGEFPLVAPDSLLVGTLVPELRILLILLLTAGVPYLLLSSTSTVLQLWYAEVNSSPHILYAASNAGSLLGLIAYPFLAEPYLSVTAQMAIWSAAFLCTAFLLYYLSLRAKGRNRAVSADGAPRVKKLRIVVWLVLSALPVAFFIAVTAMLTSGIAPVPFLWLVPFAAYLLALIVIWTGMPREPLQTIAACMLLASTVYLLSQGNVGSYRYFTMMLSMAGMAVFSATLIAAGRVYDTRPETASLSLYYLIVAIGGGLGAALVSVAAPLLFADYYEYTALVALLALMALAILNLRFKEVRPVRRTITAVCVIVIVLGSIVGMMGESGAPVRKERNFYGVVSVAERTVASTTVRTLRNGKIMHGFQFLEDEKKHLPTSYYTEDSGVGLSFVALRPKPLTVGVVGLGVGTLAAYCETGDRFVFYEINPLVTEIAHTDFSYLSRCADVAVVEGDARRSLEGESDGTHDLLVIDAFTDDSIPMHLLTKEALALYKRVLSDSGIIAVHVSNRYLSLAPVVAAAAEENALTAVKLHADTDLFPDRSSSSLWVMVAKDASLFEKRAFETSSRLVVLPERPAWTDDWSDLWDALRR